MRTQIDNKTTGRTFTLHIIQDGDVMIRNHKKTYECDEPLVGIFDRTYNFDSIPHTSIILGYMIKTVPLSEFHQQALESDSVMLFDRDITDWSLDADGIEQALDFLDRVERDLNLDRPMSPSP